MTYKTGSKLSWHPALIVDSTTLSYWFNWRVILCAIWVLITISFASFLIWKYEGFWKKNRSGGGETVQREKAGFLYDDETWRPCLKGVHPAWLLAFRVIAFSVLLTSLIATGLVDGASIFYYYTQWTCTFTTIYFGLGSLLSMYGCFQYHKRLGGDKVDNVEVDPEQGIYAAPAPSENSNAAAKHTSSHEAFNDRPAAGFRGYFFQIIFQMNAGAVLLTDCVFWFIIVPFLEIHNYSLNILVISMHTINAVLLLGDASLNSLRFPMFRIAYFFLWTVTYVLFQWIVHSFVKIWWPYPFLDLSSSYAPLWYLVVAVMHIPCYGVFALAMRLKHTLLSRWFPDSYQCVK